jgi:molybdopterin synthase catalytic subunit
MIEPPFLTGQPIDAAQLEQEIRDTQRGAVVIYQGVARQDKTDRGEIIALEFEAYEAMALEEYLRILAEAKGEWPGCALVIQHRTGRVKAGQTHFFVAAASQNRDEAFQACHYVIEQVKTQVPLWKKDIYADGNGVWSHARHETMLLSDQAIAIPES